MSRAICVLVGLLCSWPATSAVAQVAEFIPLGTLPGGSASYASSISPDGRVVVGRSDSPGFGIHAFSWSKETGMLLLPLPTGAQGPAGAHDLTADGSIVVGVIPPSGGGQSVRWINGVAEVNTDIPSGWSSIYARAISDDGSVFTGHYDDPVLQHSVGYRWSESSGFTSIGPLSDDFPDSQPLGVSGDGSTIVGQSGNHAIAPAEFGFVAFRWTADEGFELLDPQHNYQFSQADGVSYDGSVIVGRGTSTDAPADAFRWTSDEGLVSLGHFYPLNPRSRAFGITPNGKIIVGGSVVDENNNNEPFIWDSQHGMRNLATMLTEDYGIDLNGWQLGVATGVSADGRTITGWGKNPQGSSEAWVVTLPVPEPGALVLTIIGVGVAAAVRWRSLR